MILAEPFSLARDGDKIYLFGFSRGAYLARVVAGMIAKVCQNL